MLFGISHDLCREVIHICGTRYCIINDSRMISWMLRDFLGAFVINLPSAVISGSYDLTLSCVGGGGRAAMFSCFEYKIFNSDNLDNFVLPVL